MANYDLSIDQARAEKWKNDVDVEIERVQELLKKVAAIQMTIPGDDDPIMQGITNVCENLESFWTSMIKGFRSASSEVDTAIQKIGKTVGDILNDINGTRGRIGK